MSKAKAQRRVSENEAMARMRVVQTSPRKLNLVTGMIRGLKAQPALAALTFSKRRAANDVKKVLQAAIANAENNHRLDIDQLMVAHAYVGRGFKLKRFHARARGRGARVEKTWSNLTVIVRTAEAEEKKAKRSVKGTKAAKDTKATDGKPPRRKAAKSEAAVKEQA
ncbi:MAG TPA: 50S ribosomal protein L22 [Dongiaceae bacterium]|nr:50S ribosomal protein L22 [Dongiaceae bacterium]